MLNDYVTPPIEPTEIERTHRIYRKASLTTSDRPPDIIVKFQSYRTRARLLTKDAMVQLREASEDTSDKDKMFISEDLTTVRKELFFKTRTLKKQGHIKSTFTRDGKTDFCVVIIKNDNPKLVMNYKCFLADIQLNFVCFAMLNILCWQYPAMGAKHDLHFTCIN